MIVLVLGATGATGRQVVEKLVTHGHHLRVLTRNMSRLPECARNNPNVSVTISTLLDLDSNQLAAHMDGCDAVVSCLGHNGTLQGIFRDPYFVRDSVSRVYEQAKLSNPPNKPLKYVLMSSSLVLNPSEPQETKGIFDRVLLTLLRALIPAHRDNEKAAMFLDERVGAEDPYMEWVAVRPEGLTNIAHVTRYDVHPSPTTTMSTGGQTSRINVAHFMAELVSSPESWSKWCGKMPFIINSRDVACQV
jgi:nucleoside-diphosphate-sugar epimerase